MGQIYIEDLLDNKICKDILSLSDKLKTVIIYVTFKDSYTKLMLSFSLYCSYNKTSELKRVCETILSKYNLTTNNNYAEYEFSSIFDCDNIDIQYRYAQTKDFVQNNLKNATEFVQLENSDADYFSSTGSDRIFSLEGRR